MAKKTAGAIGIGHISGGRRDHQRRAFKPAGALLDEAQSAGRRSTLAVAARGIERRAAVWGRFRDKLLERGRGTMHRTARAEVLCAPLKTLLAGVSI